MTTRRSLSLLLTAFALTAAGCGSQEEAKNSSSGGNELASNDSARVLQAKRAIDAQCGSGGVTNLGQLEVAVSTLADITKELPGRVYETGNVARAVEMTTVASDTAKQLQACGVEDQAARLLEAAKS